MTSHSITYNKQMSIGVNASPIASAISCDIYFSFVLKIPSPVVLNTDCHGMAEIQRDWEVDSLSVFNRFCQSSLAVSTCQAHEHDLGHRQQSKQPLSDSGQRSMQAGSRLSGIGFTGRLASLSILLISLTRFLRHSSSSFSLSLISPPPLVSS